MDERELRTVGLELRRGGLAVIPTDTVYGLAAHGLRQASARRIFQVKRRPETKPILLLAGSAAMARGVMAREPEGFAAVAAAFWPGPLTLVVPAGPGVPRAMRSARGGVAVRLPNNDFVRRLALALGAPLTGTSANRSGWPAAQSVGEARRQFRGERGLRFVDGGRARGSQPSTVLDLTVAPARILREGPVSYALLRRVIDVARPGA